MANVANAIQATLVEAMPYILKYRLTTSIVASNASSVNGKGIITNSLNGATPDLATDSRTGAAAGRTIQSIMDTRRFGYGPFAVGALTQAQARTLLASDRTALAASDATSMTCEMFITPRTFSGTLAYNPTALSAAGMVQHWACDASIDASGNPTVVLRAAPVNSGAVVQVAYLTIRCRTTSGSG